MTESSPSRPVPGPPVPGPAEDRAEGPNRVESADRAAGAGSFTDLEQLPVADHVAVFEAEHARLQDELSTIDEV